MKPAKKDLLFCISTLFFISLACSFSLGGDGGSSAEKTLEALYIAQTVEALESAAANPQENGDQAPTPTIEVTHTITPGQPGWVSQWWLDTDSSGTATQKRAYGGDYLSVNLLERPFTAQEMVYRPDVDLTRVEISQDTNFYYFILHLSGVNQDANQLTAHYGVEIDLNRDGRGDLLLWALADGSSDWNIDNVAVYRDSNGDVGGNRPLQADAPGYSGDSYDEVLFSIDHLNDPDAAWKRVDPANSSVMQLAIKKSLLSNATTFMWNGWADDGVSNPEQFDYNDFFTLADAGSPLGGTADYPLKALFLADNTCRLPYGFKATGNEPGVCLAAKPEPTSPPPVRTGCDCDSYPNYTFIDDPECCVECGYVWYGTQEFPCGPPTAPPPCDCSAFTNYTFIDTEACCEFCGHIWTGDPEFPCTN